MTVSKGYHTPYRWLGVANGVAEHLDERYNPHNVLRNIGAINAAQQFFDNVKYGIAIDKKEITKPMLERPPMYGICAFSIAIEVLEKTKPELFSDGYSNEALNKVDELASEYIRQLSAIKEGRTIPQESKLELFAFFTELRELGIHDQSINH